MKKSIRNVLNKLRGQPNRLTQSDAEMVEQFNRFYYDAGVPGGTWKNTKWLGVTTFKCPLDLWIYQEILFELRPDVILETGTANGGSALYLASICDLLNQGKILTVDVEKQEGRPVHPRVGYLHGSSVSPEILGGMRQAIRPNDKVVVFLDSDHRKPHVLAELRAYADLVTLGSYMVVEDSNINGHPVFPEFGPGPMEALNEFLVENKNFSVDAQREKFYLTFNPRGFLRRIK